MIRIQPFRFRHYYHYALSLGFLRPKTSKTQTTTGLLVASAVTLQMASRIAYSNGNIPAVAAVTTTNEDALVATERKWGNRRDVGTMTNSSRLLASKHRRRGREAQIRSVKFD